MTHFRDGEPCLYGSGADPGMAAVGWLEPEMPYARGEVDAEFVEALRRACRFSVNHMRGFHLCGFCEHTEHMLAIASAEGGFHVGNAEIRVLGPRGTRYRAPNLVIHYVEAHGYRPPDDFIDGVRTHWTTRVRPALEGRGGAVLVTYGENGTPLASPVDFTWVVGAFEVVVDADGVPARNLERRPDCSLTITGTTAAMEVRDEPLRFPGDPRGLVLRLQPLEPRVWDLAATPPR